MQMRLMREIRFSLGPESPESRPMGNSWSGVPGSDALVPHVILRAIVTGPVDPRTGYLCNITVIDRLLRDHAIQWLRRESAGPTRGGCVAGALRHLWPVVEPHTPRPASLVTLTLCVTPHLSFTVNRGDPHMVSMTYAFEFSAAHRLYCEDMSAEENQRTFGPCTNPNGHGHNYVVSITLTGDPDPRTGTIIDLGACERIVNAAVIDRFDHKHLNMDCPEFSTLNPSVENITRVVYDKLDGAFAPATLTRVRVYETPKTYAEYTGE